MSDRDARALPAARAASLRPQPAAPFSQSGIANAVWQTLDALRADLKARFAVRGQPTAWAAKHNVTDENLLSVLSGRREPGPKLLARLGYERQVIYRRTAPCPCRHCTTREVAMRPTPPHEMIFGTIDPRMHRYFLCETCGNKRCPHAADHRNPCTDSNEPGQPGSSYPAKAMSAGTAKTEGLGAQPASAVPEGDLPEPSKEPTHDH